MRSRYLIHRHHVTHRPLLVILGTVLPPLLAGIAFLLSPIRLTILPIVATLARLGEADKKTWLGVGDARPSLRVDSCEGG